MYTQIKSLKPPYPNVLELARRDGHQLPADAISGADWTLTDLASADRLRKMEKAGIPLGEYVQGQIYRGLLTGFNAAFVITGETRSELISADPESAEIIKPLAVGDDVRRWRINSKDKWLIVTKIGVDIKRYPAVLRHLKQWQPQLKARGDKGNYWWELRACVYYDKFNCPKIVYPEIGKEARFAFDLTGALTNNKAFIIPLDDLYLLGVLNSVSAWTYAKSICAALGDENQGGRVMLQWINFKRLPIPTAAASDQAAIATLVQKCLDAKGVGCEAWEQEINDRVAALYGL